jgi:hypothetical protein
LLLLLQLSLPNAAVAQKPSNTAPPRPTTDVKKTTPQTAEDDKPEPKFIWGLLLNVVLSKVGSALMDWALNKLTDRLDLGFGGLLKKSENVAFVPEVPRQSQRTVWDMENIVLGEPPSGLKLENGQENFQGLVVSLAVFDAKGQPLEFRPINASFKTGEKFKLRVLSTFDGQFTVHAQSPSGKRQKLFPQRDQAISVPKGQELLIPAQRDLFFEFSGQTGDERLLISMVGTESGSTESTKPVYRKDDKMGSFFVQESLQQAPVIVQTLKLRHE